MEKEFFILIMKTNMKEISKTMNKMVMVNIYGKMEINFVDNGNKIKEMEKELFISIIIFLIKF